jgi:hypothetical protein
MLFAKNFKRNTSIDLSESLAQYIDYKTQTNYVYYVSDYEFWIIGQ